MYNHMYMHTIHACIYIYIYIYRERERDVTSISDDMLSFRVCAL